MANDSWIKLMPPWMADLIKMCPKITLLKEKCTRMAESYNLALLQPYQLLFFFKIRHRLFRMFQPLKITI